MEQCCRMGNSREDARAVEERVKRLDKLTPGDFAVVMREHYLSGVGFNAVQLLEKLTAELATKSGGKGKVGFL